MPHPEPIPAQSRKNLLVRAFYWCLLPGAVLNWFSLPASGYAVAGALCWLAFIRSRLALATVLTLAFLAFYGSAGVGAAAFLIAALGGRLSLIDLGAIGLLAGGLMAPGHALGAAAGAVAAGLLASVAAGWWRAYGPDQIAWRPLLPSGGLALVLLTMVSTCLLDLAHLTATLFYRQAPGRMHYAGVGVPSDSESLTGFWLDAAYDYEVDGRMLRGSGYKVGVSSSLTEGPARAWVAAHPPGTPVTVYYAPWNPSSTVLSREVDGGDRMLLLFFGVFGCAPVLAMWLGCEAGARVAGWWMLTVLGSWPLLNLVDNILPLYVVGIPLGISMVRNGRTSTSI